MPNFLRAYLSLALFVISMLAAILLDLPGPVTVLLMMIGFLSTLIFGSYLPKQKDL